MSEGKITIRLKIDGNEFQVEGSRETILSMIEADLPRLIEAIYKVISKIPSTPTSDGKRLETSLTQMTPEFEEAEAYPSIHAESCSDAIIALLSTEWGRRKPRALSEIMAALEANALHYSRRVIGFTLTRLTRRQKVRRWKTREGFVYTAQPSTEVETR
ncbi:MAG: hypothetical protein QXJ75_00210 [Candidatus Bathyarchaeia archaeon]